MSDPPATANHSPLRLFTIVLVFLGVINASSFLTERLLDWEEYRIYETASRVLLEHLSADLGYGMYHKLSHWLAFRLFDSDVIGLRFFSVLAGIAALLLAIAASHRWFRDDIITICTAFTFALGAFFLDYARWGISGYAAATVFYIATFAVFLKIAQIPEAFRRADAIVLAVFGAIGVFVLFHTAIAAVVGPAAIALCHIIRSPRDWIGLRRKLKQLAWFGAYPLAFVAVYAPFILVPRLQQRGHTHSAESYKPHLYFAHNDNVEASLTGAATFYAKYGYELLSWLLRPIADTTGVVAGVMVAFAMLGWLVSIVSRSQPRFFVAVYFAVAIGFLIALNLAQIYPFGNPRYAFFLFFPFALLFGFGVSDVISVVAKPPPFLPRRVWTVVLAAGLCALAVGLSAAEAQRRMAAGARVADTLGLWRDPRMHLLVQPRYKAVVRSMITEAADRTSLIDTNAADATLLTNLRDRNYRYIVTVTRQDLDRIHPELARTLAAHYENVRSTALHDDPAYESRFHKYDIQTRLWRKKPTR